LTEIDEEFLRDESNYSGPLEMLRSIIPSHLASHPPAFKTALNGALTLLGLKDGELAIESEADEMDIELCAENLYGFLHARYILTRPGLLKMAMKFQQSQFGTCPRIGCRGSAVLPIGISDRPMKYPVKLFCPFCHDLYNLDDRKSNEEVMKLDGDFFGRSFPTLFMETFPDLVDEDNFIESCGPPIWIKEQKHSVSKHTGFDVFRRDPEDPEARKLTFRRRSVWLRP
jgi:casein kinase II subunit beta